MSSRRSDDVSLALLVLGSAVSGAMALWGYQKLATKKQADPETCHDIGHGLVWGSISGAMNAAMMYTGDKLELYKHMRRLCEKPGSSTTAVELAEETVCLDMFLFFLFEFFAHIIFFSIYT